MAASKAKNDEQIIEEAKTTHGDVAVFQNPSLMIFRTPRRVEYQRFQDELSNDNKSDASAMHVFVLLARVHPDDSELKAILDRYPAKIAKIARTLQTLAGAEEDGEIKKA